MLKLDKIAINDILENVDITFETGKTYVIMGSNGVGKSTLLHSIMGRPDIDVSGDMLFNGEKINDLDVSERANLGIFLGFQNPTPIPGLSNFQLVRQAVGATGKQLVEKLKEFKQLSEDFGLGDDWDKKSVNSEASGGQKKKNELMQLSLMNKSFAMLDEPDSGLDVDGIQNLINFLNNWKSSERTLVVVTHYEKLIHGLNPDVVINLTKDKTVVGDVTLAEKIFNAGFKNV